MTFLTSDLMPFLASDLRRLTSWFYWLPTPDSRPPVPFCLPISSLPAFLTS